MGDISTNGWIRIRLSVKMRGRFNPYLILLKMLNYNSSVGVLLTIKQNYLCCGKGGKVRAKPPIPRL